MVEFSSFGSTDVNAFGFFLSEKWENPGMAVQMRNLIWVNVNLSLCLLVLEKNIFLVILHLFILVIYGYQ